MITVCDPKDIDYSKLCCLYFYTNWLIPNKKITNMISSFEEKESSMAFYLIDCEYIKSLVSGLKILEVPTFVFFNNNKEISRFSGITLTKGFNSYCYNIIKEINGK
jgi:thioredoxin-like negative regulator of GroEL